ncbi:hypothetical protein [Rhodospirillum rubrum]|uniref:hypothetical protein n=1 Tax=Rhodospirillum rubrum TaxID=1085 RepID=UPI001F5B31FA|nr:hypothetical protein [Rhodospirillum rubrum]
MLDRRPLALAALVLLGTLAPPAAPASPTAGDRGLVAWAALGGEAAWAASGDVLAPAGLLELVNHLKGA